MSPSPRTREDGRRSRELILETAARLATLEGLEGLSIGRLAEATGKSKSGVYAHFSSKEELQLATIDTALAIFEREVTGPALAHTCAIDRLRALCDRSLSYTERRVFPGGCFFVSSMTEFRAREGPVRQKLAAGQLDWLGLVESLAAEARADGDLPETLDPARLAFEINAFLEVADLLYLLNDNPGAVEHARAAIADRLGSAATSPRE